MLGLTLAAFPEELFGAADAKVPPRNGAVYPTIAAAMGGKGAWTKRPLVAKRRHWLHVSVELVLVVMMMMDTQQRMHRGLE